MMSDIAKQLQGFSYEQRRDWIANLKAQADQAYKAKQFDQATAAYLKALMGFSAEDKDEREKLSKEFSAVLTLNMAMSELEGGRPQKALIIAKSILNQQPTNPLGYFRRGVIDLRLQNYDDAM